MGLRPPEVCNARSHGLGYSLGFLAHPGLMTAWKSSPLTWQQVRGLRTVVGQGFLILSCICIPKNTCLSFYLFFCLASLISHHLLPRVPSGSDLGTQL